MSELDVTLRDGRMLHVYDDGDPGGHPVVVHHGTPGSGLLYGPEVDDARERGLRLIGYDRAGYGGSSPNPGRRVADVAADIADVLQDLMVPPDHGRWLAARIPGVEAHISEEDGHLTISERRTPEIHQWLLEVFHT